jgi:hypothetical protein
MAAPLKSEKFNLTAIWQKDDTSDKNVTKCKRTRGSTWTPESLRKSVIPGRWEHLADGLLPGIQTIIHKMKSPASPGFSFTTNLTIQ